MPQKLAIDGGSPVRDTQILYSKQSIDEQDIAAVVKALRSPFITCGPEIENCEQKLCALTGAAFAAMVSSGTAALHAACSVIEIGKGDEVITTPITFAASANCVLYCGGTPIFADINPKTYTISPESIEERITSRTKAIIAVDYTGQAADLDPIKEICASHKLILIEDAAHSIGTRYNGYCVGSIADLTTFSFHPVKTVTGGEGGAILTNDEILYKKMLRFRAHGITRDSFLFENKSNGIFYHEQIELGYNYRLTDLQAALISSQLDKLSIFSKRRKEIVGLYNQAFADHPILTVQEEISQSDSVRHLYVLRFNLDKLNTDRKGIFNALWAENVCCNLHYIPVYYHPYYQKLGYKKGLCPNAEGLYEEILSLPLYYSLSNKDVSDVITAVFKVIDEYKK